MGRPNDLVIISKFEKLRDLLSDIENNPNVSYMTLSHRSRFSGGSFTSLVHDAKIMDLIKNGGSLRITELGNQFLHSFNPEIKKRASLNVPLFLRYYKMKPEPPQIREAKLWFKEMNPEFDERFLGSVARRYLEGVFNIRGIQKTRMRSSLYHEKQLRLTPSFSLKSKLKEIGFTEEELYDLLDILKQRIDPEKVKKLGIELLK